jgi:DNA-binding NtrC family response regulator
MGKKRILIVDDEESVREMLADLFGILGYEPIVARNGKEALNLLEKQQVSLVISDIKMPIMDGIEMVRQVRERYPSLDVILITGYKPDYSWKEVMKAGACDYITKPFDIDTIEKKVKACLESKLGASNE